MLNVNSSVQIDVRSSQNIMPIRLVDSNEDRMKEDVSQNKKQNPDQSQDEKNLTKAITA